MAKKRPAICFIDDEVQEIKRFNNILGNEFIIGSGTALTEAINNLKEKKKKKPDLFVLDLYFPERATNTHEELEELQNAREDFLNCKFKYRSLLSSFGLSTQGGFKLANQIKKKYKNIPIIYFTRKGTLEDSVNAYEQGAIKVLKKPDPNKEDFRGRALSEAYDEAFRAQKGKIVHEIKDSIKKSSWFQKNRKLLLGLLFGIIVSLLTNFLWHLILKYFESGSKI